jgi:hypothetical protein
MAFDPKCPVCRGLGVVPDTENVMPCNCDQPFPVRLLDAVVSSTAGATEGIVIDTGSPEADLVLRLIDQLGGVLTVPEEQTFLRKIQEQVQTWIEQTDHS